MVSKAELHKLIDELPDELTDEAAQRLAELEDPVLRSMLLAPPDDEPTTPEEDASAEEAWQEYLAGRGKTTEQVRRELGL
jgi:hypothetical protein